MRTKLASGVLLALALALAAGLSAGPAQNTKQPQRPNKGPLKLIGVIAMPGNPLVSSDIAWVDPGTKRFYLAGRSNFGIDVIDAENNLFVGRITGFAGINTAPIPPNIQGPNGVLVTSGKKLWAGDGNSILRVADVDPQSPDYLKIIQTISTAIPECGTRCNRVDELGYDEEDHIIAAVNHDSQPASAANTPTGSTAPAARFDPYVTFISADTYKVLGAIPFKGAGGLEQPLWDPGIHRFFLSVGGYRDPGAGSNPGFGEIAVINPKTLKVEKTYNPGKCRPSGEVMGPSEHLFIACGAAGSVMMNALNGKIIATVTEAGGGDENWYNPGDGRFYFTAPDRSTPPVNSLVVVDAQTGAWLQNVPDPGARQAVALASNNHIFTAVQVTPAIVSDPSTDKTTCSLYGFKGTGCIAVFAHADAETLPATRTSSPAAARTAAK